MKRNVGITLDEQVIEEINARRHSIPFSIYINEMLRIGLEEGLTIK